MAWKTQSRHARGLSYRDRTRSGRAYWPNQRLHRLMNLDYGITIVAMRESEPNFANLRRLQPRLFAQIPNLS